MEIPITQSQKNELAVAINTLQELAADGARGLFFRIDFLPPRLLTAATANALEGAGVKLFFENGRPARCLAGEVGSQTRLFTHFGLGCRLVPGNTWNRSCGGHK